MNRNELKTAYSQTLEVAADSLKKLNLQSLAEQGKALLKKMKAGQLNVALIGATSSGKTTILNHLLNEPLLKTRPRPNSGTLVVVQLEPVGEPERFYHQTTPGEEPRPIDRAEFQELAERADVLAVLSAWLPARGSLPAGSVFMDVPGYNSLLECHDRVISQWLPEMDLLFWVLDARRGFAAADLAFAEIMKEQLENPPWSGLTFILNCPNSSFAQRAREVQKQIGEALNIPEPVLTAVKPVRLPPELKLDISALETQISRLLSDDRRERLFLCNVEEIGWSWLTKARLNARVTVSQIEAWGEQSEEAMQASQLRLEQAFDKAMALLAGFEAWGDQRVQALVTAIPSKVVDYFEERMAQTSCLDIDSTRRFLLEAALPENMVSNVREFEEQLNDKVQEVCQEIEALWPEDLTLTQDYSDPELANKARNVPGEKLAGHLGERVGGYVGGNYLKGLGGRAGGSGVAGMMNLSRKLMGKVNWLSSKLGFGKVFGKKAMNSIGSILKRIGLTSSRAATAFAYAIMELAALIWKSATWKDNLRTILATVLKNEPPTSEEPRPLYEIQRGMNTAIIEIARSLGEDVRKEYSETKDLLKARTSFLRDQASEREEKKRLLECIENLPWPKSGISGE